MASTSADLDAVEALERLRSGTLSAEALTQACLDRIARREPLVHAWSHVDPATALRNARSLDRLDFKGPLFGLPVGVKDVILTNDMPTQYNSPIYQGHHPRLDAACVKVLRRAGAVILGKTETVEFAATGRKAPTRNPRHLDHSPGGSSSGSAAAVADGHAPLALGTQTGGSIIRPASYCGVFGMKPTWSLISTEGVKRFSTTLDTLGWFARSAADLALLFDVFDPPLATRSRELAIANARIGVCRTPMWSHAEASTRAALRTAADRLGEAGARVETFDLPPGFEGLAEAQLTIMRAEGAAAFLAEYRSNPDELDVSLRQDVENHWRYTADMLRAAHDLAARCRASFDALASGYDAILAPSTVGEAPRGLSSTGDLVFNGLWTLLHVPCINVPGLQGPGGLPVGLTLIGPRYSDWKVLAAARAVGAVLADAAVSD